MIFSSPLFLCYFLPIALGLYFIVPRGARLAVLTLLSYVFYAWSGPWFLLLLIWTTLVDFIAGGLLAADWGGVRSPRARRTVLGLSLTNSIGLLIVFKYGPPVAAGFGWRPTTTGPLGPLAQIALPAGISFYTFESISYVLDIYRHGARSAARSAARPYLDRLPADASWPRKARAHARGLIAFACYIAQFPHLVAGPIIRFQELQMQLLRPRYGARRFARGTVRVCLGLGKKVLIADTLGPVCDAVFGVGTLDFRYAWSGAAAAALQIYFDFSGYSDMAIGLGMMLGFRFPENFESPYKAASLTEFWRRWHMTLSRWLRDYIYIPLGGNRRGKERTLLNLILTMLIGGIWHGAGLTFVAWGLLHGLVLAAERAASSGVTRSTLTMHAHRAATLLFLLISWPIFRAQSLTDASTLLGSMANPFCRNFDPACSAAVSSGAFIAAALVGTAIVFVGPPAQRIARRLNPATTIAALIIFMASLLIALVRTSSPFLYFKF